MKKQKRFLTLKTVVALIMLLTGLFALTACGKPKTGAFIGTFKSVYVDVPGSGTNFELIIKKDRTFVLERKMTEPVVGEKIEWKYTGTWMEHSTDNEVSLLCITNEAIADSGATRGYFVLSLTDDGKIVAIPSVVAGGSVISCFGEDGLHGIHISLVIFAK